MRYVRYMPADRAGPTPARYHQLDALRGLGCLCVMFIHGAWLPGQVTPAGREVLSSTQVDWLLMQTGHAAVEMFFALSAFLLWRPFTLAAQSATGRESVRGYALRRIARVVPGYWAALALIALWQATPYVLSTDTGGRYFGFAQNLHTESALGGIGPAWTLAVEMQFYVLLGVLALARRYAPRSMGVDLGIAGAMIAGAAVWRLLIVGPTDHLDREHLHLVLSLPAHLDSFGAGIALAALSARHELTGLALGRLFQRWPTALFAAGVAGFAGGIALIGMASPFAIGRMDYLGRAWLYVAFATALIAPFALAPHSTGFAHSLLNRRTVVSLGRWSFGAYLWHMAIFTALGGAGLSIATKSGFVLLFASGVAVSFVLGAISWVVLERPLVRLAHRYRPGRREPAAVQQPSATRPALADV